MSFLRQAETVSITFIWEYSEFVFLVLKYVRRRTHGNSVQFDRSLKEAFASLCSQLLLYPEFLLNGWA